MFRKCFLPMVLAAGLIGCAPEADQSAERAPAMQEEVQAAPASPTRTAITIPDPATQVNVLGRNIDIPFEFRQVYDRMRDGANGVSERQVGLVTTEIDVVALAERLEQAIRKTGMQTKSASNKNGWVWITINNGAEKGKVAVRPNKNKPGTVVVFKIPQQQHAAAPRG